ncbi:hypothetical protein V6N11_051958 [Hibiscus sabdariffa]|uniref:Uncharacterized protein n=1 Tax=Hibiscus sabdariffa TaxID=183260 RepID=A0ABR2U912_9ROSI
MLLKIALIHKNRYTWPRCQSLLSKIALLLFLYFGLRRLSGPSTLTPLLASWASYGTYGIAGTCLSIRINCNQHRSLFLTLSSSIMISLLPRPPRLKIQVTAKDAWSYPPPTSIKVNVDGAFDISHGATIYVLARDDRVRVLEGMAQHITGSY